MTQETDKTAIDPRGTFKIDAALDKLFGRGPHARRDRSSGPDRAAKVLFTSIRRRGSQEQNQTAPRM